MIGDRRLIPCALVALACTMSCSGNASPPATSPSSSTRPARAELPGHEDEVASKLGATLLSADEVELMRVAYRLVRQCASPTDPVVIQADALAEEAETFALLGDQEEAEALWLEAIMLLEPAIPDTSQRQAVPR